MKQTTYKCNSLIKHTLVHIKPHASSMWKIEVTQKVTKKAEEIFWKSSKCQKCRWGLSEDRTSLAAGST